MDSWVSETLGLRSDSWWSWDCQEEGKTSQVFSRVHCLLVSSFKLLLVGKGNKSVSLRDFFSNCRENVFPRIVFFFDFRKRLTDVEVFLGEEEEGSSGCSLSSLGNSSLDTWSSCTLRSILWGASQSLSFILLQPKFPQGSAKKNQTEESLLYSRHAPRKTSSLRIYCMMRWCCRDFISWCWFVDTRLLMI